MVHARRLVWLPAALVLLLGLAAATHLALAHPAAPHQGALPDPPAADVLLSSDPALDGTPALAYDSERQQYLALWNAGSSLRAQLLDRAGVPIGEPVEVATVRDTAGNARVAFTPSLGRYLVVWCDYVADNGGAHDVYGQLLDAEGRLVLGRLAIYDGQGDQTDPSVSASSSDFLVVWQGHSTDDSVDVVGRRLSSSGLVEADAVPIATAGGASYVVPDVAYHPQNNGYLVAYQHEDPAGRQLLARRVPAAWGAPPGAEVVVAAETSAQLPRVAALAGPAWLVTWSDGRSGSLHVFGRPVSVGPGTPPGQEFTVAEGSGDQFRAVVATGAQGGSVAVWEQSATMPGGSTDLAARPLGTDGLPTAPARIIVGLYGEQCEAAAALGDDGLVIWRDRQSSDQSDIFGMAIDEQARPLWTPSCLSAASGSQTSPALALGSNRLLAVWESERDGKSDIVARRLAVDGSPVEQPWILEGDGHSNVEPTVAYEQQSGVFVVVWADATDGRLEARRVPPEGTNIIVDQVPDSLGARRPRLAPVADGGPMLLVWQAHDDVYARVHLGVQTVPPAPSVAMASGVGAQDEPSAAYLPGRDRFLVAWRGGTSGAQDIYGRLVDPGVAPIDEAFVIAGGGDDPVARHSPEVAAAGNGNGFVVAYMAAVASKQEQVRLRWVTGEGGTGGSEISVGRIEDGREQADARVAYDPAAGAFDVVWSERMAATGLDLLGFRLDLDGTQGAFGPIFRGPGDQRLPALGVSGDGTLLVAWEDNRRGKVTDVYVRPGGPDVLPPVAVLQIQPPAGPAGTTFLLDPRASADGGTPAGALRARWDFDDDGTFETAYARIDAVTRTLAVPGLYRLAVEVEDMAGRSAIARGLVTVRGPTPDGSPSATASRTPWGTPSASVTASVTGTATDWQTPTPTRGATRAPTRTSTDGPTPTRTPWGTPTMADTPTAPGPSPEEGKVYLPTSHTGR
jgi:hypothetical protein